MVALSQSPPFLQKTGETFTQPEPYQVMVHDQQNSGTPHKKTFSNICISTEKMNYSNDNTAKPFVNQVVLNSLLLVKLEDENQLVS